MLETGTLLNGMYRLVEEIGSGGGGIVYKAYHENLRKYVVVKQIKDVAKGVLSSRGEADILKNLRNTYLPQVYDFLEIDGEIYTVIDYVDGESFDKALRRNGRFRQKDVLKWANQLAEALAYLHRQKPAVIHSDIKPANIMLTPGGDICLIDFNVSLAFDQSKRLSAGISKGYSPPEQYYRTDLYYSMAGIEKKVQPRDGEDGAEASGDTGVPGETGLPDGTEGSDRTASSGPMGVPGRTELPDRAEISGETELPEGIGVFGETDLPDRTEASDETDLPDKTELSDETDVAKATESSGQTKRSDETELPDKTELPDETELPESGGKEPPIASEQPGKTEKPGKTEPPKEPPARKKRSGHPEKHTVEDLIGRGVDERSDIYSLGATLYCLLTGNVPSRDFSRIVPLSQCDVSVSDGLTKIIEKMMQLNPDDRFQNGMELREALKNIKNFDKRQRSYRLFCIAGSCALLISYAAGGGLVYAGTRLRFREQANAYSQELEQASGYMGEGQFAEAQACIDNALQSIPTRIDAYERQALLLYDMGEYQKCVEYGRDAVNSPQYFIQNDADRQILGSILYVTGNAYYELGDYADAVNCFELAISYYPDNSAFYRDMGIALARSGNTERAAEVLDQAKALGLGEESVYMLQGEIALAEDRGEEAAAFFQNALRTLSERNLQIRCVIFCSDAYESLGSAYRQQEIDFLEKWQSAFGVRGSSQVTERLAEVYARGDDYDKALELFLSLESQGYRSYQLYENIAILYQELGRTEEAETVLQGMLEQYPDRYTTFKRLAFLEADRQQKLENGERDYAKMREYYEKALALYEKRQEQDGEMLQLKNMMDELTEGGWFE